MRFILGQLLITVITISFSDAACKDEQLHLGVIRWMLGIFTPLCDHDGSYLSEQCDYRISECWCVDESGEEIFNTRFYTHAMNSSKADCHEERRRSNSTNHADVGQLTMMANLVNSTHHPKNESHRNTSDENVNRQIRQSNQTETGAATNATTGAGAANETTTSPSAGGANNETGNASAPLTVSPSGGPNATNETGTNQTTNAPSATNQTAGPASNASQPESNSVNATSTGNETSIEPVASGTQSRPQAPPPTQPPFMIPLNVIVSFPGFPTPGPPATSVPSENGTQPSVANVTVQAGPNATNISVPINATAFGTNATTPGPRGNETGPIANQTLPSNISEPVIAVPSNESVANETQPAQMNATNTPELQNATSAPISFRNGTGPISENNTCGANTIYSLCTTQCPNGCDQLEGDLCETTACTSGCICASGFVRQRANDSTSPCIRQSSCGQAVVQGRCTDPNSEWSTCGTPCEETCQFRPSDCPKVCAAGCFCKDGYVKESTNSSACVPRNQCVQAPQPYQQQCQDLNAVLSNCGSACPATCQNPRSTCKTPCTSGCFCKNGFIKESQAPTARCIASNQCGQARNAAGSNGQRQGQQTRRIQRCPDPNASWSDCGTSCPETCKLRSSYCTTACTAGCYCNSGFVKKSSSPRARCVPRESCPQQSNVIQSG